MITMLLGGLWHGAAWRFVAWGGLHGTYLVGEREASKRWGHVALWKRRSVRLVLAAGTYAPRARTTRSACRRRGTR